ncbi:hypothetical protein EYF80_068272 [Liparis tanakae]|uniref:Uncharacterized protein n=1 Tax=Liparis tanakae TaxID=230148 RepID=A0A4Z2DYM7_9TELE|nr:hypothetical protein EYF80_068272 [Liparis tanakae]
MRRRCTVTSR